MSPIVFIKDSSIVNRRGASGIHQATIIACIKASDGITRAQLINKLSENLSWVGSSKQSVKSIVDSSLTKLRKNGAVGPKAKNIQEQVSHSAASAEVARSVLNLARMASRKAVNKQRYLVNKARVAELKDSLIAKEAELLTVKAELDDANEELQSLHNHFVAMSNDCCDKTCTISSLERDLAEANNTAATCDTIMNSVGIVLIISYAISIYCMSVTFHATNQLMIA